MKKILILQYSAQIGGASISVLENAICLKEDGYDVKIVFYQKGPLISIAIDLGVDSIYIPIKSIFFYGSHVKLKISMVIKFFIYFPFSYLKIKNIIEFEKPEIILLNTSIHLTSAIAAKNSGVSVVWNIRESLGENKFFRLWHSNIIKKYSDQIILVSNYLKKYFPEQDNLKTVYNSIDLKKYSVNQDYYNDKIRNKYNIGKNVFLICMIGSVQKVKGHFLLINLAKELKKINLDFHFLLIGAKSVKNNTKTDYVHGLKIFIKNIINYPIDNADRMQRIIDRKNLSKYFSFTSGKYEIHEIISATDIVAFLSMKPEGFGRPLIEGMAMGKPILAINIGPTKEIIGNDSGILIDDFDAKKIAKILLNLSRNNDLYSYYASNGEKRVKDFFQTKYLYKKFLRIIKKV